MYFLESRKHLKNQELDPSLVRDRQGFASRKNVAWASLGLNYFHSSVFGIKTSKSRRKFCKCALKVETCVRIFLTHA